MYTFIFFGLIQLDLLLDSFAALYGISKSQMEELENISSEDITPISYYQYILFAKGEFRTAFEFLPHPSCEQSISYLSELYIKAWILSQKLNTEIIVSATDDILIPYQCFLIKDGVFYLATEIIPDDSDDEDYGRIIDYTTLEPVFDKLPEDVQDYILANAPKV